MTVQNLTQLTSNLTQLRVLGGTRHVKDGNTADYSRGMLALKLPLRWQ